jgi:hypothetical protein
MADSGDAEVAVSNLRVEQLVAQAAGIHRAVERLSALEREAADAVLALRARSDDRESRSSRTQR